MIVEMREEHVAKVSEIDIQSRPGDFLPALGGKFLTVIYKEIIRSDCGFGYVFLKGDQIAGFIIGNEDTSQMFMQVIRNNFFVLVFHLIFSILKKPLLIKRIFQTFLYTEKAENVPEKAELLVIGVYKQFRRTKVGEQLVSALNSTFTDRGISGYKVTVNKLNEVGNSFFRNLGFEYKYSFILYGKEWNLYTFNISSVIIEQKICYSPGKY